MKLRLWALLVAALLPFQAFAQSAVLQGGARTAGHVPIYSTSGTSQPTVIDSGPAGGNVVGQGLSEFNQTNRGTTAGTGPNGEHSCFQSAVSTNSAGYYALCLESSVGGIGLLSYGAYGGAADQSLVFKVNSVEYAFPFAVGGIVGPGTTVVSDQVCWNNTTGTLVKTCTGASPLTIGGSSGQIQYNNAGALGGFTMSGDATINTGTGAITVTKVNNVTLSLGGTVTTAAAFTQAGAFATILTSVGSTNVTLPQTGTLSTLAGSEALTNKSVNGLTITASTGTLTITNGKTFTASNTLAFAGTDGSTLNIGTGGTLGSAAFTAVGAYVPSNTQITNSLGADVALSNTGLYFTGPTVAQGSTGTWCAAGTVTVSSPSAGNVINAKLWDGSTVLSSAQTYATTTGTGVTTIALSGCLATPAGNLRISVRDTSSASGLMLFNASGNSKDSSLAAWRTN